MRGAIDKGLLHPIAMRQLRVRKQDRVRRVAPMGVGECARRVRVRRRLVRPRAAEVVGVVAFAAAAVSPTPLTLRCGHPGRLRLRRHHHRRRLRQRRLLLL